MKIPDSLFIALTSKASWYLSLNDKKELIMLGPFGGYVVEIRPDIEFTKVVKKGKTITVKKTIDEVREYKK